MTGTDSSFSVTCYGGWHAREIELFAGFLGFTPGEALRSGTSVSADFLIGGDQFGAIEVGRQGGFVVCDRDPLSDVGQPVEKERFKKVWLAGKPIAFELPPLERKEGSNFSYKKWQEINVQDHVGGLRGKKPIREIVAAAE